MKIKENFKNWSETIISKTGYILGAALLAGISITIFYFATGLEPMFIINPIIAGSIFAVAYGIFALVLVAILHFGKHVEYHVEYHTGFNPVLVKTDIFDNRQEAEDAITAWEEENLDNSAHCIECWE